MPVQSQGGEESTAVVRFDGIGINGVAEGVPQIGYGLGAEPFTRALIFKKGHFDQIEVWL